MKKIITPLLALVLAACSSGSKEAGSLDSTAVNDTVTAASLPEGEPIVESEVAITDTSQLVARFDEVSQEVYERHDLYYTVYITTSQYEAASDVTWYFDDEFSPRYFKMTWSAEGNEGSTEFFIKDNTVVCGQEEESNELVKWCSTTGGTRTTWSEDTGDSTSKILEPDYGKNCNADLERYVNILTSILNEGEITEQDENSYTVRIEKTVTYGEDFTESTEVKIPKKVYESIKGE